jgi:hypothetical protein
MSERRFKPKKRDEALFAVALGATSLISGLGITAGTASANIDHQRSAIPPVDKAYGLTRGEKVTSVLILRPQPGVTSDSTISIDNPVGNANLAFIYSAGLSALLRRERLKDLGHNEAAGVLVTSSYGRLVLDVVEFSQKTKKVTHAFPPVKVDKPTPLDEYWDRSTGRAVEVTVAPIANNPGAVIDFTGFSTAVPPPNIPSPLLT